MAIQELSIPYLFDLAVREWGLRLTGFNFGEGRSVIIRRMDFLIGFTREHAKEVTFTNGILLIGNKQLHPGVLEAVLEEQAKILEIVQEYGGDRKLPLATIYIGTEKEMQERFRTSGSGRASALLGGIDCFLNADDINKAGIHSLLAKRIMKHEPRHTMLNSVLPLRENGYYATDLDKIVHEALAEPGPELWIDIPTDNRIVTNDISEFGIWKWNERECNRLGHHEIFFANPVSKAFYEWVDQKQTIGEWYQQALNLS